MQTETTTTAKKTEAELMQGGPADITTSKSSTPNPNPITETTPEPKVYELNGKKFDSPEEMSSYVAHLELVNANLQAQKTTPIPSVKDRVLIDGKPVEEVLFDNPVRFAQWQKEQTLLEISKMKQQEDETHAYWDNFYRTNPDLKGKEKLVSGLVAQNMMAWKDKPKEQVAKILSQMTRDTLKEMGFNQGTVTEVPRSNAATLNSQQGTTPTSTQTQTPVPQTFFDQVKAMRRKKVAK